MEKPLEAALSSSHNTSLRHEKETNVAWPTTGSWCRSESLPVDDDMRPGLGSPWPFFLSRNNQTRLAASLHGSMEESVQKGSESVTV
jgi:hypothetical protein